MFDKKFSEDEETWCHILGYGTARVLAVKAAHIVPKSLESAELSYLFGVGEMPTMVPQNGRTIMLTLGRKRSHCTKALKRVWIEEAI